MKERTFQFVVQARGTMHTKREIILSLQQLAREKGLTTFTQKMYNAWPYRVLSGTQVAARFGSWAEAMVQAGLVPIWGQTKDLSEMVELFKDCWEAHGDAPTDRVLEQFLRGVGSRYTVSMYKRAFGGVRELAQRVSDHSFGKISEQQLLERRVRLRGTRRPISPALRTLILKRDGHRCIRCHSKGPLEVHHKDPVSTGGSDDPINLETLCELCHKGSHARAAPGNKRI